MRWDPARYLQFDEQRARPFLDLLARVGADAPGYVVDLGCGPGNLTRVLADRWPSALVEGLDSSAEMVDRARADQEQEVDRPGAQRRGAERQGGAGRVRFEVADLRSWAPDRPVDVLTCNATLQWVPGHLDLLPTLVGAVAPGGWLAFQVPGNFDQPTHTELAAVRDLPRWRERLAGVEVERPWSAEPGEYLERLLDLGCSADVWETTYLQVLTGEDAVVSWMLSTGLRPVLSALDDAEQEEFLVEYRARTDRAYPATPHGTVLPYRRVFAVARTPDGPDQVEAA
jgi:trans-aconitate 2-methyltransferase